MSPLCHHNIAINRTILIADGQASIHSISDSIKMTVGRKVLLHDMGLEPTILRTLHGYWTFFSGQQHQFSTWYKKLA